MRRPSTSARCVTCCYLFVVMLILAQDGQQGVIREHSKKNELGREEGLSGTLLWETVNQVTISLQSSLAC